MRLVYFYDFGFSEKSVVIESHNIERKTTLGPTESVVIEMTLYRGFFTKTKREKKADRRKFVFIANLTLYGVSL